PVVQIPSQGTEGSVLSIILRGYHRAQVVRSDVTGSVEQEILGIQAGDFVGEEAANHPFERSIPRTGKPNLLHELIRGPAIGVTNAAEGLMEIGLGERPQQLSDVHTPIGAPFLVTRD